MRQTSSMPGNLLRAGNCVHEWLLMRRNLFNAWRFTLDGTAYLSRSIANFVPTELQTRRLLHAASDAHRDDAGSAAAPFSS